MISMLSPRSFPASGLAVLAMLTLSVSAARAEIKPFVLMPEITFIVPQKSKDRTLFSSSWGRSSSDWVMMLDPQAFSDGILRVGYAINDMTGAQVKKVRK